VTTNYPGTWWDLGLGVYYALFLFPGLSVQAGPAIEFAAEGYQNDGDPNNYQFYYLVGELNLRILAMITRNLGVFTTLGVYWDFQDTQNVTTGLGTSKTEYGIQSLSAGVAYYFK